MHHGKFLFPIGKRFVEEWNMSHREIVKFLSLKIFKTHLDRALSNLIF